MDKCNELISLRVPIKIKEEYDQLSDIDKKHLKRIVLEHMARYCWAKNHFDPNYYFSEDTKEDIL